MPEWIMKKRWWRHVHMTNLCLWADRQNNDSQSEGALHPKLNYYILSLYDVCLTVIINKKLKLTVLFISLCNWNISSSWNKSLGAYQTLLLFSKILFRYDNESVNKRLSFIC